MHPSVTPVEMNFFSILPAILVIAGVTFFTRAVVFYGLKNLADWPFLKPLRDYLPSCALLILSAYALRGTLQHQPQSMLAILIALGVMTAVHGLFRKMLFSLIVGMVTVVFCISLGY